MDLRALMLVVLMLMTPLSGCFAPEETVEVTPAVAVEGIDGANGTLQVERGMYHTLSITSNVDYTVTPGPSMFLQDNTGTHRVGALTYPASTTSVTFLVLDSEASGTNLSVTAGEAMVWVDLTFVDASTLMLVDGERAYETIDILTSQYNNRWCASAGPGGINHEGGAAYEAAAEAMALKMWDFGFDHVEVTRYPDDPDQLNVVGYNWGNVNPDEYIVIGGHFDIAYAFTPPSGGTNEGANDDTSGSTVSLEMGQALAQMEFDHTVVQALWACEEEGLLGSLAYVANLPRERVRSRLHELRHGGPQLPDCALDRADHRPPHGRHLRAHQVRLVDQHRGCQPGEHGADDGHGHGHHRGRFGLHPNRRESNLLANRRILRIGPLRLLQRRLPHLQFLQPRWRHQLLARVAFPLRHPGVHDRQSRRPSGHGERLQQPRVVLDGPLHSRGQRRELPRHLEGMSREAFINDR